MSDSNTQVETTEKKEHWCHKNPKYTPFVKGNTYGKGRPKGSIDFKKRMQKFLDLEVKIKLPDGRIEDKTVLDQIIMSLLAKAAKGNLIAIREVLDRVYGKADQKIEVENTNGFGDTTAGFDQRLSEVYERAANAFNSRPALLDATPIEDRSISADDSGAGQE